ncbi:MAG: N4-gp56 family major capsid protein [Candidatus Competibacter sp.]
MAITTYGDISQRTAYYAAATMLAHGEPVVVLGKFGQNRAVPRNKSKAVKFRRALPFAVNTTPLVEGVTPKTHKIRYEDVPVTLQQYGDVAELSDIVYDTIEDAVLNDMAALSGENAAEVMETVAWGVVKAGTNKFYANGSARNAVNTPISLNKQRAVIRALRRNRAKPITEILSGSSDSNTTPIEGGFIALGHTDLEPDIRNLPGFVPTAKYGTRRVLDSNELGSVEGVRYILSPLFEPYPDAGGAASGMRSTSGTAADVYPLIVLGKDAWAHVPLAGQDRIIPSVINPNKIDKSDPLGQRGYVGWKALYAAVILNDAWMAVLEVAATELV